LTQLRLLTLFCSQGVILGLLLLQFLLHPKLSPLLLLSGFVSLDGLLVLLHAAGHSANNPDDGGGNGHY
jgi:hypothetical protein